MKRVLRTAVLGACVAAAVAFGGVHEGGDDPGTRAQPVPPPADLFRTGFGGGPFQSNDCDGLFSGSSGGADGATGVGFASFSGAGSGGMAPAAFSSTAASPLAPGVARNCLNIRG